MLFALIVAGVYVIVRVASYAHFRTKLEYFRRIKHEVEGGPGNGKD